jgi:S1-C subfamily serine protease
MMKKTWRWLALMVAMATILACQSTTSVMRLGQFSPTPTLISLTVEATPTVSAQSPSKAPGSNSGQADDLSSLYDKVSPGVVAIIVTGDAVNGVPTGGLGSGFVYDLSGNIITNFHVVDGAKSIEVDFPSGLRVEGKVVGSDPDSDLAVINVQAPKAELKPLLLGDSSTLKVGQVVVAIGNPFGMSSTMTSGIVSALGRTNSSLRSADGPNYVIADVIQTDTAINPGNSGGPLLDLNGNVVGINRAIRTTNTSVTGEASNSGISFAVAVNLIKRIAPEIIKNGKAEYPYLGLSGIDLSDYEKMTLSQVKLLGLNRWTGVYVANVTSGGPADKAGVRAGTKTTDDPNLLAGGDLIIAVDGHAVQLFGDLVSYMTENKGPGDPVVLRIIRDNQEKEVTVILGKRP